MTMKAKHNTPRQYPQQQQQQQKKPREAENLEQVEALERELVEGVSKWSLRFIVGSCVLGVVFQYMGGQPLAQVANPLIVAVVTCAIKFWTKNSRDNSLVAITVGMMVLALVVFRHAVFYQGCSACVVPAIYGFMPCAMGFMFRVSECKFHMLTTAQGAFVDHPPSGSRWHKHAPPLSFHE